MSATALRTPSRLDPLERLQALCDPGSALVESGGARMQEGTAVRAFAGARVPKLTVVLRKSYGRGVHHDEFT